MTRRTPRNRTRSRSIRSDYDVGYGKPPTASQFSPGQSGNPRGRPRKKTEDITLADILEEKQVITDRRGRSRRVCTRELIFRKLVHMAASGDKKAIQMVLSSTRAEGAEGEQAIMDYIAELSNDYLDGLVDEAIEQARDARIRQGDKEGSDDE